MIQRIVVKGIRMLLSPFSLVYALVLSIRNLFYDNEILKQTSFAIPVIAVGNLRVGGTGKTPQVEYFVRLLQEDYTIAILSRGYKRKSKGFVIANASTSVEEIGDEPFQYFTKFSNITVAVDADRVHGIRKLLENNPKIDLILLDDAYQHRKVKASFYALLTPYDKLYTNDYVFPYGNLRENRAGAKRANAIVVTKCPIGISKSEKEKIRKEIAPLENQAVFFSSIQYDEKLISDSSELPLSSLKNHTVLLITGIANPKPLVLHLKSLAIDFIHLKFPDHHNFEAKDLKKIKDAFENIENPDKWMVTTEKDYTRLSGEIPGIYSLGIRTSFLNGDEIDRFVKKHLSAFNA